MMDIILIGLVMREVMPGKRRAKSTPATIGIPSKITTVRSIYQGSISIGMIICEAFSYNPPQKAKLAGVKKMEPTVAIPVRLTDKAVLPLARLDIKLEMLPPGQEATKSIPRATLGVG